ncbi:MAG: choline oxidase, partial [Alphaproteobacteria bacterium]|nr:choline oxidase [Alphaproteobacteria bacterium]
MTRRTATPDAVPVAEADVVIVGGGSAGAVLARRLADSEVGDILLIEAGEADEDDPTLMDIRRLGEQRDSLDWGYRAARLAGGPADLRYGRARCLGGCGNHNDCAWLVPPDADFERWEASGAIGWGPAALRPAFDRVHDTVAVAARPADHPVTAALLDAAAELGHPPIDATRGAVPGAGMMPLNATGRQRNSASVAYLHPLDRLPPRLRLITGTAVLGLDLDPTGRRVVGCRTDRGPVRARREVILAAGAIGSPVLLMHAGIGDPETLASAGIAPRVALTGVGRNLANHASASVVFELADPVPDWAVTPYESVLFLAVGDDPSAADVLVHLGLTAG